MKIDKIWQERKALITRPPTVEPGSVAAGQKSILCSFVPVKASQATQPAYHAAAGTCELVETI